MTADVLGMSAAAVQRPHGWQLMITGLHRQWHAYYKAW